MICARSNQSYPFSETSQYLIRCAVLCIVTYLVRFVALPLGQVPILEQDGQTESVAQTVPIAMYLAEELGEC